MNDQHDQEGRDQMYIEEIEEKMAGGKCFIEKQNQHLEAFVTVWRDRSNRFEQHLARLVQLWNDPDLFLDKHQDETISGCLEIEFVLAEEALKELGHYGPQPPT
jgi:hypothetical protein